MIYLVGGAPRCGKTIFSKMLSKKKRISWISTDGLESVIKVYNPEKFPKLDTCKATPKQLLAAEIKDAKTLWPGVERLIRSMLKWKHDYVIEGVHLLPQLVAKLKKLPEWKQIKVVYLVKHDTDKIIAGFKQSDPETDWLVRCIKSDDDWQTYADMVMVKAEYMEKEAKKYGFKLVNTENNFKKTITNLLLKI